MNKIRPYPTLTQLVSMDHTVESWTALHKKVDAKIAAPPC
jgi:hypothetical protein